MRRKRETDGGNDTDRWVVSYADFITLLFAFFTTLYAISRVDTGKLQMFTGSVKSAFKTSGQGANSAVIEGIAPVSPDMIGIEKEFRGAIGTLKTREDVGIRRDNNGIILSLGDNLLFDSGSAVIKPDAAPALSAIATVIRKIPNRIIIEGHTDNLPINDPNSRYSSNWELSAVRAASILNHLLKNHNLPAGRFSTAGYAEFRPIMPNSTPEGRAKNRRVDIVVLNNDNK